MVRDLLDGGQSLLLMGRPGVGKTTALREIARVLADELERRVVVIDTSNEIAGDGDIPHPAIGRARRMQVARLGQFGGDNRAGIERTLHRISAIRNRQGEVVGLTCRVGRAVFGTVAMVRDLLDGGQSLLLMGRPGVGKTTALREIARVLADELERRVVVIDTSNEIAGDGDIPHPAIGRARRMQVARPCLLYTSPSPRDGLLSRMPSSA